MSILADSGAMNTWVQEKRLLNSKIDIYKFPLRLLCDQMPNLEVQDQEYAPKVAIPSMSTFKCRICKEIFQSHRLQQLHFKSDSHVNNVRSTLSDADRTLQPPISDDDESNSENDASSDEEEVIEDTVNSYSVDDQLDNIYSLSSVDSLSNEGMIHKRNSKAMGLQLVFQKQSLDFEFGVSAAVYDIGDRNEEDGVDDSPWQVLCRSLSFIQANPYSCVIGLQSGRFAAAVFCAMDVVIHKTFRRYTVRAKAGGAQSTHDKGGRKANSMGASLRRYGEQALREDIHQLLQDWRHLLDVCAVVLIAVPRAMRGRYIYNADIRDFPLSKGDRRIRDIPFSIGKPTFEEVRLAHEKCMSITFGEVSVKEEESSANADISVPKEESQCLAGVSTKQPLDIIPENTEFSTGANETSRNHQHAALNSKYESVLALPDYVLSILHELGDACNKGDLTALKTSLDALNLHLSTDTSTSPTSAAHSTNEEENSLTQGLTVEDVLRTPLSIDTMSTLLHIASERGHAKVVFALLQAGCSPSIMDVRGRYPYFLAKDKDTRDAFRRYRGMAEDAYDWDQQTGVPSALTDDIIKAQKDKEKEKKKRSKQKKKNDKEAEEKRAREEEAAQVAAALAVRESAGNCDMCSKSLFQAQMYEVFDKKCCSSACVVLMRRKLMAEAAEKRLKK